MRKSIPVVLLAVLLFGCGHHYKAYPASDPPYTREQVAVLKVPLFTGAVINSIDGKPLVLRSGDSVELLPGNHEIAFPTDGEPPVVTIPREFLKGKTYTTYKGCVPYKSRTACMLDIKMEDE